MIQILDRVVLLRSKVEVALAQVASRMPTEGEWEQEWGEGGESGGGDAPRPHPRPAPPSLQQGQQQSRRPVQHHRRHTAPDGRPEGMGQGQGQQLQHGHTRRASAPTKPLGGGAGEDAVVKGVLGVVEGGEVVERMMEMLLRRMS